MTRAIYFILVVSSVLYSCSSQSDPQISDELDSVAPSSVSSVAVYKAIEVENCDFNVTVGMERANLNITLDGKWLEYADTRAEKYLVLQRMSMYDFKKIYRNLYFYTGYDNERYDLPSGYARYMIERFENAVSIDFSFLDRGLSFESDQIKTPFHWIEFRSNHFFRGKVSKDHYHLMATFVREENVYAITGWVTNKENEEEFEKEFFDIASSFREIRP